jgi:serine/threonine protein kinase
MRYKMTTTATFQIKPDFYSTQEECVYGSRRKEQTNPRYRGFNQTHFTAGDEEQFQQYRDTTNGQICIPEISLSANLFKDLSFDGWSKYKNVKADAVINTFRYIFHKFKKGIYVRIIDNKLRVFLPFSKANFTNEWSDKIKVDKSKYGSMIDFIRKISEMEGRKFNPRFVNENLDEWYGNNCLVRYEYPLAEGDTNATIMKNILEELCAQREIPDIEFFINRRDFPILTKDGTEPYNHIWGSSTLPLVSHSYDKYIPILSMSKAARYADVLMPTWEDWARVQSYEGKWFPRSCRSYATKFDIPWEKKKPIAVFRGGTTGCGVTIDSNPRLKLAYLSTITNKDADGQPLIDAGVTNWNLRPRKLETEEYLRTIEIDKMPFGLSERLSPLEQSSYKYIINVDGHVTSFRLSLELSMGSVILLTKSDWKIWYQDMLIPYTHYVPVKEDLSDLINQIKWCKNNDAKCQQIAQNAKDFFNTYLQKKGILDFIQKTLVELKNEMNIYLYNTVNPLNTLIENEYKDIDFSYPDIDKPITDLGNIPLMGRSYGLFRGLEWCVRKIITESSFNKFAIKDKELFRNKLGVIEKVDISGFSFVVKSTSDSQKIKEHIHETYVGTKCVNQLLKHIPNFAYVFGLYREKERFSVVTEYIRGETLHEYISNQQTFRFDEYLFILMQLCLAIQTAQNMVGMVHYDLTPWNIILQRTSKPVTFDYIISHKQVVRVKTSVIPVIIDYGKSHVIYDGEHHGFVNMFHVDSFQDILTIFITSINQVINSQRLPPKDFSNLLKLVNFISCTGYCPNKLENAKQIRFWLRKVKKYTALINDQKYELSTRKPYDLIKYIMKAYKSDYRFSLGMVKEYRQVMNKGNPRQVFEYMFAKTVEEKVQTYENVFIRLKQCSLPQPTNLFFIYYVAQQLEESLESVKENMISFLTANSIPALKYEKIFRDTMKFLYRVYQPKISTTEETNITYDIPDSFNTLVPAPYTEETFLLPESIMGLMSGTELEDLTEYKDIITNILLYRGVYALSEKDKKYYIENFKKLLEVESLNMHNNCANFKTLRSLSKQIYQKDLQETKKKMLIATGDCSRVKEYVSVYEKLVI